MAMRRHLTYANVVASLALFVALGGVAGAASGLLNGHKIVKHSIPASRSATTATRATSAASAQTASSAANAATATTATKASHATSADTATVAQSIPQLKLTGRKTRRAGRDTSADSSRVDLSVGQEAVLLQKGYLSVTGTCSQPTDGPYAGKRLLSLYASMSADAPADVRWFTYDQDSAGFGPRKPGDQVHLYDNTPPAPGEPYNFTINGLSILSTDGVSMSVGGTLSLNEFADCSFSMYSIG
jgi:hypothetical protein